jgi:hypothetical protein
MRQIRLPACVALILGNILSLFALVLVTHSAQAIESAKSVKTLKGAKTAKVKGNAQSGEAKKLLKISKMLRKAEANRAPAQEQVPNREIIYNQLKDELEKSLKRIVQVRAANSANIRTLLKKAEDRWSVNTVTKASGYLFSPNYNEQSLISKLQYVTKSGFQFDASVDLYEPSQWGRVSGRNSPFNYGLAVSQDLIQFFGKSNFQREVEIDEMEARDRVVTSNAEYLQEILKLIDLSHSYFLKICKKRDVEMMLRLATETMRVAEVQQAAKTISMGDLLRIKETILRLQQNQSANDHSIQTAILQFGQISPRAEAYAKSLESIPINCEVSLEDAEKLKLPDKNQLQEIISLHPNLKSLEIKNNVSQKSLESYSAKRRPVFSINTGADQFNSRSPADPYQHLYVGLNFSYRFKGDEDKYQKIALQQQITDLSIARAQTLMDLTSFINQLYEQMKFQVSQIPLVRQISENSSQMVKILEARQQISQVDASAIESVFNAYTQSVGSQRELVTELASVELKISEIQKVTKLLSADESRSEK